jgi:hypothetical protein
MHAREAHDFREIEEVREMRVGGRRDGLCEKNIVTEGA